MRKLFYKYREPLSWCVVIAALVALLVWGLHKPAATIKLEVAGAEAKAPIGFTNINIPAPLVYQVLEASDALGKEVKG